MAMTLTTEQIETLVDAVKWLFMLTGGGIFLAGLGRLINGGK